MTNITSSSDTNACTDEKMEEDNTNTSNVAKTDGEEDTPEHPYRLQLAEFQPNVWQLEEREPEKYLPLEETTLTIIDSQELLDEMMTKLKHEKEIAINLEHHIFHSFNGFVCLLLISTRAEDFIVDAIKLKEEITVLNEVCTDPNILKVLHRSNADIIRLQKDFGIYIVNMFDTLEAARNFNPLLLLNFTSLAHLLKETCGVNIDKNTYKMADWRVRPLPSDMLSYAREGTHYLLYIYDIYRNKCLHGKDTTDVLKTVYEKSTKLCGLLYIPLVFKEDAYKRNNEKLFKTLSPRQLECNRLLYKWRYETAREHDESIAYTMPIKMLFEISKKLPRNVAGITACCLKDKALPPLLEKDITHVLTLVKKAIDYVPEKSVADKKSTGKQKLSEKKWKEKAFCFVCGKSGHWMKDCYHNQAAAAVGPYGNPRGGPRRGGFGGAYGNPRGDFHRGAYGGGYGNPRGDFHRGAYGGGYVSRGSHPVPTPYSRYEGARLGYDLPGYGSIPRPIFRGYGPIRPRFGYY